MAMTSDSNRRAWSGISLLSNRIERGLYFLHTRQHFVSTIVPVPENVYCYKRALDIYSVFIVYTISMLFLLDTGSGYMNLPQQATPL